ncbi:MAG TPA: hypothetical protein VL966_01740, partial [Alphaproteobacteria bacterium]|nr:hypothetical protein [Alphaproteobacteria bacterium]
MRAALRSSSGVVAAVLIVALTAPHAAFAQALAVADGQDRGHIYAPWSPDKIAERRKEYGLIGPGSSKPYPPPRFPASLKVPNSIEEMMPGARAAVAQTGGRTPLGYVKRGERVLMVVPYDANPTVQEAIRRAFTERGAIPITLYENEAAGIPKETVVRFMKARQVFTVGDGQQEPAEWFFRSLPDPDKTKAGLKDADPGLYAAMFPQIQFASDEDARLSKDYNRMVREGLLKWLDAHPEVDKIFFRGGGRPRTRVMLAQHGKKFVGNYTYNSHFDLMSRVPSFPSDVWRMVESKMIEALPFVDRLEASDPEGTALAADVTTDIAQTWAKGVYNQGHLYMYPNQSSGRWPMTMMSYPDLASEYLQPVQVEVRGIIASTNNHVATHPRMEIELADGKIKAVRGGGYYGEFMRYALNYPGMQTLTWPLYKKPGYWWLYEAGTATNPKYFKHPDELLEGRNTSERNVGGVIHWSFGTETAHGPETIGQVTPT